MLQETIAIVSNMAGTCNLYFDVAIIVKNSPHRFPVSIWGVCVKDNQLAVMDSLQDWWEVSEDKDRRIIESVYQRMKLIEKGFRKAQPKHISEVLFDEHKRLQQDANS